MKSLKAVLMALGLCAVVAAQSEHVTPFTGTWKLNVAKSIFDPRGQNLQALLPWSDGKEVSVTASQGFENVTAVSKIQGMTFSDTWRRDGKIIEKVHAAVSLDGTTLAISVDGTDARDRVYHNRLTFEKQ